MPATLAYAKRLQPLEPQQEKNQQHGRSALLSRSRDLVVLVLRPFNAETFFGVALIGHPRTGRYYFPLGIVDDREAVANLSQARLFDTKRLIRKIGTIDDRTFRELAKALALTLFPFLSLK